MNRKVDGCESLATFEVLLNKIRNLNLNTEMNLRKENIL